LRGVVFKQRNTDKCSQRCQWPVCCLHRAQQCRHTPVQFPVSMQCHQFGRIWLFKSARNACFIIFWIQVKCCHFLLVLATYIYSLTHSLDTNTSFFYQIVVVNLFSFTKKLQNIAKLHLYKTTTRDKSTWIIFNSI